MTDNNTCETCGRAVSITANPNRATLPPLRATCDQGHVRDFSDTPTHDPRLTYGGPQ